MDLAIKYSIYGLQMLNIVSDLLRRNSLDYEPTTLLLRSIEMEGIPSFNAGTCCKYLFPDSDNAFLNEQTLNAIGKQELCNGKIK